MIRRQGGNLMQEKFENLLDKLNSIVDRVLELVTGSGHRVQEAKVRVPELHRLADAYRQRHRVPPSGLRCDHH